MQALWARVAQVRSTCRCSLCSSPANALSRSSTGVPIRRRINQSDVFLAFSGTLAFEAVVWDSAKKEARSRQWDSMIAEGREEIEATEASHKLRVQALLDSAEQRAIQDKRQQDMAQRKVLDWSWQGVFTWTKKRDELRSGAGFEDWKGPSLSFLKQLSTEELRELQSDNRILRYFYGGSDCEHLIPVPYTPNMSLKKLRTLEWSMTKLVLKILWNFCRKDANQTMTGIPTDILAQVAPMGESSYSTEWLDKRLAEANMKLEQLASNPADSDIYQTFERPVLPRYDDAIKNYDAGRIDLNNKLHQALQEMKGRRRLGSRLAKICQHLLVSRTPPNIHAYNLLLVRFCQIGESSLVNFVLEAMWESHIRPNEITHATVLRFFTVTGNKTEFSIYVKRMKGKKGGLALANPNKTLSHLLESRIHTFGEYMHKFAEKARMNHEVYSALIIGQLRFFGPEDAMYWYRGMIDEGWRPTAELLTVILQACCETKDWAGGIAAWKQFAREAIKTTLSAYEWVLRLCHHCEQQQMFYHVLHDGIREGMLPAEILHHAGDFGSRDISLVLADVKSKPGAKINKNMVNEPLFKRLRQLRKFEALEGRPYLVANSLSGATTSELELNSRIQASARDARSLHCLRIALAKYEKDFDKISAELAVTIDEVGNNSPMVKIRTPVIKMRLSESLKSLHSEIPPSPSALHGLYSKYLEESASKLQRLPVIAYSPPLNKDLATMSV